MFADPFHQTQDRQISLLLAKGVVDFLEVVDIDQQQAHGMAKTLAALHFGVDQLVEAAPVGNAGQGIRGGGDLQLLHQSGSLRDIPQDGGHLGGRAQIDLGDGHLQRKFAAVSAQTHHRGAGMHRARIDGGAAEGFEIGFVIGAKTLWQQGFQPLAEIALIDAEHLAGSGIDKLDA